MITTTDLLQSLPLLIVAASALIILIIEAILPEKGRSEKPIFIFSILALIAAFIFTLPDVNKNMLFYNSFMMVNPLTASLNLALIAGILITVLSSRDYLISEKVNYGEYYSLLFISLVGMMLMVMAYDLVILFVGLEIMSVCFYVLAGFMRKNLESNESGLKYFLLGSFITGFFLMGIAFTYGTVTSTNYGFAAQFKLMRDDFYLLGIALIFIAFIFKTGSFPLQMWIPDVYQGAPTSVTAMMSSVGKTAAFGAMLSFFTAYSSNTLSLLIAAVAVSTMLYGNVTAILQTNIKRLLAFSSIAHAGYILVGFVYINTVSTQAIVFYLISYILMQIGAFIIVEMVEDKPELKALSADRNNIEFYKGLGKSSPGLASLLTIFLLSLAGIPPLAGFWGKYYIFYSAIVNNYVWLAIIGILLSLIGVYYYIRIILYMWFHEPVYEITEIRTRRNLSFAAAALSVIGLLMIGVYPDLIIKLVTNII